MLDSFSLSQLSLKSEIMSFSLLLSEVLRKIIIGKMNNTKILAIKMSHLSA